MTLDELIERVEKGEGTDRGLDEDVHAATGGEFFDRHAQWKAAPAFTTSLDAVVSLIEQKMPGHSRDMLHEALDEMGMRGWRTTSPMLGQMARAALVVLLRAIKETRHDG